MSIKNLTWPQIVVFVLCLATVFAAHKWLGLTAGYATTVVTGIVTFLLGRPTDATPPPPADEKGGAS